MPIPNGKAETFQREFLTIRAKLIELAAALDRIDRGEGSVAGSVDNDARVDQIHQSIKVLGGPGPGRAERIQMLFSLPYDDSK